jgi:hypothetical protein
LAKSLPKEISKATREKGEGIKWGLSFVIGIENNTANALGSGKTTLNGGLLLQANFKE